MLSYFCIFQYAFMQFCVLVQGRNNYFLGALFSNELLLKEFSNSVNDLRNIYRSMSFDLLPLPRLISNPKEDKLLSICQLISQSNSSLAGILTAENSNENGFDILTNSIISSILDVPLISLDSRLKTQSNPSVFKRSLNILPSYSSNVKVWNQMIINFQWTSINIISNDDYESNWIISFLSDPGFNKNHYQIANKFTIEPNLDESILLNQMKEIESKNVKIILLLVNPDEATRIFKIAEKLEMLSQGWIWLVSEQILNMPILPQGIIGSKLKTSSLTDNMKDAIDLIYQSTNVFLSRNFQLKSPNSCDEEISGTRKSEPEEYFKNLKNTVISNGRTGSVMFDEDGERLSAVYEIVNTQTDLYSRNIIRRVIGKYEENSEAGLTMNLDEIYWPGNYQNILTVKQCLDEKAKDFCPQSLQIDKHKVIPPVSFVRKKKLKIVTIENIPFIYKRIKEVGNQCKDSMDDFNNEIDCRLTDHKSGTTIDYCCYGYCIDLLKKLSAASQTDRESGNAENAPFTFDLHLVGDGKMGEKHEYMKASNRIDEHATPGQEKYQLPNRDYYWDGIIGELLDNKADVSLTPMLMTKDRLEVVDFTRPFMNFGISVLFKNNERVSDMWMFTKPFEPTLWVILLTSVLAISILALILIRISQKQTNESPSFLSVLSFICDIFNARRTNKNLLPTSISVRLLLLVWSCFTLSTMMFYSCNLISYSLSTRYGSQNADVFWSMQSHGDMKLGSLPDSHVYEYFSKHFDYSTIYEALMTTNGDYPSVEEAIKAVKNGSLDGFLWDQPRLQTELCRDKNLLMTGDYFATNNAYGFAGRKGEPWIDEFSERIFSLNENGFLQVLEKYWTLGLFILLASGIVLGILFGLCELASKTRKILFKEKLKEHDATDFICEHNTQETSGQDQGTNKKSRISLVPKVTIRNVQE